MKFVVEVTDFWLEEEELSEALKAEVKRDVLNQISASIKVKVEEAITKQVAAAMEEKLIPVIDSAIADCVTTGTIMVKSKPVSIQEHLKSIFQDHHGWNNPGSKMAEIAKRFGEELKVQYNNIFAGKIVLSMQQQGFLKDDVAKILLQDTKS